MKVVKAPSCPVNIFIAGDYAKAKKCCREWCDEVGACVTVTATNYTYTGGDEDGVIVGFINYPRFPKPSEEIEALALSLAKHLRIGLGQESFCIQTPERTTWFSWRAADQEEAA